MVKEKYITKTDLENSLAKFAVRIESNIEQKIKSKFDGYFTALKEDQDWVIDEIGNIKDDIGGVKSTISGIEEDMKGVKNEMGEMKNEIGVIKNDTHDIKEELSDIGATVTRIEHVQLKEIKRVHRLDEALKNHDHRIIHLEQIQLSNS